MKRVSLFLGHYGSGKTNIAVNYAVFLAKQGKKVTIFDLDIVNPYFRTVDAKKVLDAFGVELVVSPYAETNVDIPAMNAATYKMTDDKSSYAVVDIGGDDRGALALGRFRDAIKAENDYDAFWVVNRYRPETRTVEDALIIKEEIERAAGIKFTAIVNCSNLGKDTTAETVENSFPFIEKLSKAACLPVAFTAVKRELIKEVKANNEKILPVDLVSYGDWL